MGGSIQGEKKKGREKSAGSIGGLTKKKAG